MVVGSSIGGFIPSIWGDSALSISGVIMTAVGGLTGIWLGFKMSSE